MTRRFSRRTIARSIGFEGLGLHSGLPVSCIVSPGQEGLRFVADGSAIVANPKAIVCTTRATQLFHVSTIEHLMGALALLGITDANVFVEGGEMPALDGSAIGYYEALKSNIRELPGSLYVDLFKRVFSSDQTSSIAISQGSGQWRVTFDSSPNWPGRLVWEGSVVKHAHLIASARTFCFSAEVETLPKLGYGRGLTEASVLVLGEYDFVNKPRDPLEPVLHKVLDLAGDLYLAGLPLESIDVEAMRPGHTLNVNAAKRLAKVASIRYHTEDA